MIRANHAVPYGIRGGVRSFRASTPRVCRPRYPRESIVACRSSQHPDAIRRRMEFERRRAERAERLKELSLDPSEVKATPINMVEVSCGSDLHMWMKKSREYEGLIMEFTTKGCQSCKRLQHDMNKMALTHLDTLFLIVDAGGIPEMASEMGIETVPYFHVYDRAGHLIQEGKWNDIEMFRAYQLANQSGCKVDESIPSCKVENKK